MTLSKDSDQVWLVKKSGVVLGPYSLSELIAEIKKRNIAILDEVRTPTNRWKFIREQKELFDIVKAIREEDFTSPQATSITATGSIREFTKSFTGDIPDELTPAPNSDKKEATDKKTIQFTKANVGAVPRPNYQFSNPRSQIVTRSKLVILIPIIVIIMIGLYVFDMKKVNRISISTTELVHMAQQYQSQGLYKKATALYERVENSSGLSSNAKKDYFSLLLKSSTDINLLEKLFKEIQENNTDEVVQPQRLHNWHGLLFHKLGQYQEADQEFEKAVKIDTQFKAARLNQIVNSVFLKQTDQNKKTIDMKGFKEEHASLLLSKALSLLLDNNQDQSEQLKSTIESLENWLQKKSENKSEFLFALSALYARDHKIKESETYIDKLIETYPLESTQYIQDLETLYTVTDWGFLSTAPCQQLAGAHAGSAYESLIKIFCEIQSGRQKEAWTLIEVMQRRFPESNKYSGMQAYLLKNLKRLPEAKIVGNASKQYSAKIVLTEICYNEKDILCVENALREVSQNNVSPAHSAFWSAKFALLKNNKEIARQELIKGLALAPKYLPLIELKEEIDAH